MGNKMTMAEARAECARLGITPGRSLAECERRLVDKRMQTQCAEQDERMRRRSASRFNGGYVTEDASGVRRVVGTYDDTGSPRTVGKSPALAAPYGKSALVVVGEAAPSHESVWRAVTTPGAEASDRFALPLPPPPPRMSRTMRLLHASTALLGPTLASNPRVFCGDPVALWPRGA